MDNDEKYTQKKVDRELKELVDNKEKAEPVTPVTKDQFKLIGTYKLKDKSGRDILFIKIMPDMEGIVIQKVKGQSSKIIVAVKIKPTKKVETKEIKNEEKPKTQ